MKNLQGLTNLNTVRFAKQFPGADLGAKINAADTDLGSAPGEIWVEQSVDAGETISTAVTVKAGHTLRFMQGGRYTFTVGITLENGASMIGQGGWTDDPLPSSVPSAGTILYHNFNGDFITFNGNGSPQGGGILQNLTLWNIYAGGDLSGNAIKITGTTTALAAGWVFIDRVFTDGWDSTKRWTRGLLIDGSLIGSPQGVRDMYILNSRFTSSGTDFEDIKIFNAFNVHLINVMLNNSNNGTQQLGGTLTGPNGSNKSGGVDLLDCHWGTLKIDFADSVRVTGGDYTAINVTANTGGVNLFMPSYLGTAFSNTTGPTISNAFWMDGSNGAMRTSGHLLFPNNFGVKGFTTTGSVVDLIRLSSTNAVRIDEGGKSVEAGSANVQITDTDGKLRTTAFNGDQARFGAAASSFNTPSQSYINNSLHRAGALNQGASFANAFLGINQDNTTSQIVGLQGMVSSNHASGTRSVAAAVEGDALHDGAGTTTTLAGLSGYVQIDAGTVVNMAGLWAQGNYNGGTATNNYGLLIDDQAGVASNNWAIKTNGTAKSQFGGAVISGLNTVTFSATPTFDASLGNTQKIMLTGNVTSSTLSNATAGETINFLICQDATGSRTFVWPSNVVNAPTINTDPNSCTGAAFAYDDQGKAVHLQ